MFMLQYLSGIFGMTPVAWGDDRVVRWSAFGIATVLVLAFAARTWERKKPALSAFAAPIWERKKASLSAFTTRFFRLRRRDAISENDDSGSVPIPVRRDAEPHRGRILLMAGILGMYLALLAALLVYTGWRIAGDTHNPFYIFIGVSFFIPGLGLVISTLVLAKRDLARMASGHVDPGGTADTAHAASVTHYGLGLCIVWLVATVACWVAF
jgi:hypothetical protein